MFWHSPENIRNIQLRFVFLIFPFASFSLKIQMTPQLCNKYEQIMLSCLLSVNYNIWISALPRGGLNRIWALIKLFEVYLGAYLRRALLKAGRLLDSLRYWFSNLSYNESKAINHENLMHFVVVTIVSVIVLGHLFNKRVDNWKREYEPSYEYFLW